MTNTSFRHTPDMGEISGFGGGYEETCQQMLENGVKWLTEHKGADIKVLEDPRFYGIVELGTEETEQLEKAVMAGIKDATGGMNHAVMSRIAYIAKNGWEKYCAELRDHTAKEAAE